MTRWVSGVAAPPIWKSSCTRSGASLMSACAARMPRRLPHVPQLTHELNPAPARGTLAAAIEQTKQAKETHTSWTLGMHESQGAGSSSHTMPKGCAPEDEEGDGAPESKRPKISISDDDDSEDEVEEEKAPSRRRASCGAAPHAASRNPAGHLDGRRPDSVRADDAVATRSRQGHARQVGNAEGMLFVAPGYESPDGLAIDANACWASLHSKFVEWGAADGAFVLQGAGGIHH